jgi:hypothetical protein
MIITAPIPVMGRFPLVRLTASRLKSQGVIPIIMGHEPETQEIAKQLNVEFIHIENDPLGNKWNAGFAASRYYKADAVMFMGSSDWCSDDYIESIKLHIQDFGMLGMLGCHFADISNQIRLVHWKGYGPGQRHNEPIGIGRVLRSDFLDTIQWRPFDPRLNAGLDWSMWLKTVRAKQEIGILPDDGQIKLLSISTNKWINKHKFTDHWTGVLKSERCDVSLIENGFNELNTLL